MGTNVYWESILEKTLTPSKTYLRKKESEFSPEILFDVLFWTFLPTEPVLATGNSKKGAETKFK